MIHCDHQKLSSAGLSRRAWLRLASLGTAPGSCSAWLEDVAALAATSPARKRSCILLWMNGGPSHLDTFDLKPGHENGGPFREIATAVPGIRWSEHLPQLARWAERMAVVRSLTSKEADHGRATYLVRTGRLPEGPVQYPALGSLLAHELGLETAALPNFVSIAPFRSTNPAAYGAGYLGPRHAPFVVGDVTPAMGQLQDADDYRRTLRVPNLRADDPVPAQRDTARWKLLQNLEQSFASRSPDPPVDSHRAAYARAVRLMEPAAAGAFDLEEEPEALREAYGRNVFGHGCLLARRLVERGVPCVEVSLGGVKSGGMGWDGHVGNFETVRKLSQVLDPAWSTLMRDLSERGLLDSTLIVWMGEFGRTPKINGAAGRDHYPLAWSAVLAGGGIRGGQLVGRTSADGSTVEDRAASVPELLATICQALGLDPHKTNPSSAGRPIHLVDYAAQPIEGVAL